MDFQRVPFIWFGISGFVYSLGAVLAFIMGSRDFFFGFVSGGALILANSWAGARKVKKVGFEHKSFAMASVLGNFYIRLIALGICVYGLVAFLSVDPVGLVVGLSVVPVGLFILPILIYIANRRPEEA
jgi:hypothetical protein